MYAYISVDYWESLGSLRDYSTVRADSTNNNRLHSSRGIYPLASVRLINGIIGFERVASDGRYLVHEIKFSNS